MTAAAVLMALLSVAPMSVDIRSADGFVLKGSYFSPGSRVPGSSCSTSATAIARCGIV
jgi:hypothetical protein